MSPLTLYLPQKVYSMWVSGYPARYTAQETDMMRSQSKLGSPAMDDDVVAALGRIFNLVSS